MKIIRNIFFFLILLLASCQIPQSDNLDIIEAGNPPAKTKRAIIGQVEAENNECVASEVFSYDVVGNIVSAQVEDDCSFFMEVTIDKLWGMLLRTNRFDIKVQFQNGAYFDESDYYYVSAGDETIELGLVTINNITAFPQNQPAQQNDRDNDGINDYDDNDDDDDNILDTAENDCDEDGIIDDDEILNDC